MQLARGSQLLCPWDFPDKDTGVGCHSLLQGIFPTQGSSPYLLHGQGDFTTEPPRNPLKWKMWNLNPGSYVPELLTVGYRYFPKSSDLNVQLRHASC